MNAFLVFSLLLYLVNSSAKIAPLYGQIDSEIGNRVVVAFKSPIKNDTLTEFVSNLDIEAPEMVGVCDSQMFLNGDWNLIRKIRLHPLVKYVEYIQTMRIAACNVFSQNATWGVSRVSKNKPTKSRIYSTEPNSGKGVRIYIIDTGINTNHSAFDGRAKWGVNFIKGSKDEDDHGHGTCGAGLAAAVSPEATIYAVKAMNRNGKGSSELIIKGICWVREEAKQTKDKVIINLSLGGNKSVAVKDAVDKAFATGVGVVVAAGNKNANACNYSPADSKKALTIGSSTSTDGFAEFSNWGNCVKLIAPGKRLDCPDHRNNTLFKSGQSGTSFSSPIVAGLLANVITTYDITKASEGYNKVKELALVNVVKGIPRDSNTPNLLANNRCQADTFN